MTAPDTDHVAEIRKLMDNANLPEEGFVRLIEWKALEITYHVNTLQRERDEARNELAAERARRYDDTSNARERVLAEYERIRFEGGGHGYFLFGAAIALDTTAYDLLNDGDLPDAPEDQT